MYQLPASTSRRFAIVLMLSLPAVAFLQGAIIPNPTWYGDPDTTYQSYTFTTDSATPDPETVSNPYGDPEMLIINVPTLGGVGIGYVDPSFGLNRSGGSWDLGPEGYLTVDVPVAPVPVPGQSYIVDIQVSVVYDPSVGFFTVPEISVTPEAVVSTVDEPTFEQDGFFFWGLLTGTVTIPEAPSELITVLINATGANGSLIETVEIHTRYQLIPEASHFALGAGAVALLLVLLRRSGKRQAMS